MNLDIVDLREFYLNPLGRAVKRMLRRRLRQIWPSVREESVLTLGYAMPLLRPWRAEAERILAVMPGEHGVVYWPREGPNCACMADVNNMPLPDESVDRVVLIHVIETASDIDALLREVWRVLKSNGRALIIAPNRRGLWAHSDSTPFGVGQPYSSFQLKDTLRDHGFLVDRTWCALFLPPSHTRPFLQLAEMLEKIAGWLFPGFGGVVMVEAGKQIYAPILTKSRNARRRVVLPLPFPMPPEPVPTGRIDNS